MYIQKVFPAASTGFWRDKCCISTYLDSSVWYPFQDRQITKVMFSHPRSLKLPWSCLETPWGSPAHTFKLTGLDSWTQTRLYSRWQGAKCQGRSVLRTKPQAWLWQRSESQASLHNVTTGPPSAIPRDPLGSNWNWRKTIKSRRGRFIDWSLQTFGASAICDGCCNLLLL